MTHFRSGLLTRVSTRRKIIVPADDFKEKFGICLMLIDWFLVKLCTTASNLLFRILLNNKQELALRLLKNSKNKLK